MIRDDVCSFVRNDCRCQTRCKSHLCNLVGCGLWKQSPPSRWAPDEMRASVRRGVNRSSRVGPLPKSLAVPQYAVSQFAARSRSSQFAVRRRSRNRSSQVAGDAVRRSRKSDADSEGGECLDVVEVQKGLYTKVCDYVPSDSEHIRDNLLYLPTSSCTNRTHPY